MIPESDNIVTPRFIIEIENKGSGEALSYEHAKKSCEVGYEFKPAEIEVTAFFSDRVLACKNPNGDPNKVTLRPDGPTKFQCEFEGSDIILNTDAYTASIIIELGYSYRQVFSTDIEVERLKGFI